MQPKSLELTKAAEAKDCLTDHRVEYPAVKVWRIITQRHTESRFVSSTATKTPGLADHVVLMQGHSRKTEENGVQTQKKGGMMRTLRTSLVESRRVQCMARRLGGVDGRSRKKVYVEYSCIDEAE